jgi:hypothetical protein
MGHHRSYDPPMRARAPPAHPYDDGPSIVPIRGVEWRTHPRVVSVSLRAQPCRSVSVRVLGAEAPQSPALPQTQDGRLRRQVPCGIGVHASPRAHDRRRPVRWAAESLSRSWSARTCLVHAEEWPYDRAPRDPSPCDQRPRIPLGGVPSHPPNGRACPVMIEHPPQPRVGHASTQMPDRRGASDGYPDGGTGPYLWWTWRPRGPASAARQRCAVPPRWDGPAISCGCARGPLGPSWDGRARRVGSTARACGQGGHRRDSHTLLTRPEATMEASTAPAWREARTPSKGPVTHQDRTRWTTPVTPTSGITNPGAHLPMVFGPGWAHAGPPADGSGAPMALAGAGAVAPGGGPGAGVTGSRGPRGWLPRSSGGSPPGRGAWSAARPCTSRR